MRTCYTAIPLLWLLAVDIGSPAPAAACGFCYNLGGNALALPHPKAIEVAVATRAAVEKGLISDRKLIRGDTVEQGVNGFVALNRVPPSRLVQTWAATLKRPDRAATPLVIHFVFIDAEQSCGLVIRGGMALFEARPSAHSDARVVTTRAAFQALLDGTMNAAEARRLGLLVVEGDARAAIAVPGESR